MITNDKAEHPTAETAIELSFEQVQASLSKMGRDASTFDDISVSIEPDQEKSPFNSSIMSFLKRVGRFLRYVLSLALVLFSCLVVVSAIWTKQTKATGERGLHPIIALLIFVILVMWLSLLEGGLNCMVGLKPIDRKLYEDTHPLAFKATSVAHRKNNLEHFIVGRQYLDLMIVFITSVMVSTIPDASVLGLPHVVNNIFLDAGLAVILVVIVFGQLIAQTNAAYAMLDFINNYVVLASTYAALVVEASGILHAVYLVQRLFSYIAGQTLQYERSLGESVIFWIRATFSVALLGASVTITVVALFQGNTTMWSGVPPTVSLILAILLVFISGMMEALQIAMVAVLHMPAEVRHAHPTAEQNCRLIFHNHRFKSFLVGRQVLQTIFMFVISRITTVDMAAEDETLFGVSQGMQAILNSGVLSALMTTIFASLSWRVTASVFPLVFLSSPLSWWIFQLCLWTEATGICESAWLFAALQKRLVGLQDDVDILGAAGNKDVELDMTRTESSQNGSANEAPGGSSDEELEV